MTPAELPVFPLPNAVVFPEQQLPLHIFEPRYRQMVRDALEQNPLSATSVGPCLVIAKLVSSTQPGEPPFASIATIAKITAHHRLSDGRYNIVVEGLVRAHVEEIESDKLYRRVRCTPIAEPQGALADAPIAERMALMSLVAQVMQIARERSPGLEFVMPPELTAARMAFRVADKLLVDSAARQSVLELDTGVARVRRTTEAIAELLTEIQPKQETATRWS
jgi:ATP-dependent Lon protease